MLAQGPVDVVERERGELGAVPLHEAVQPVHLLVDGVAEGAALRRGQERGVLAEKGARRLEVGLQHAVPEERVELVAGDAQGEVRLLGRDGPDPDLEQLRAARQVRRGLRPEHAVGEVLEVGVVAVVHAARLAHPLEQVRRRVAVLAEPRPHHVERDKVGVGARDGDGKAERDGRGAPRLGDERHARALDLGHRRPVERLDGRAERQRGPEAGVEAALHRRGVAARDREGEGALGVVPRVEGAHVVQRERLDGRAVAQRRRAVGVAAVDDLVEHLLAELLVVVLPQARAEVAQEVAPDALEVVLAEAGREQRVAEELEVGVEVVAVDAAGEDGHVLVDLDAVAGGERKERLLDLGVGPRRRAGVGEHAGGELGEPLLALGIVGGAGGEDEPQRDERALAGPEERPVGRRAAGGRAGERAVRGRPGRRRRLGPGRADRLDRAHAGVDGAGGARLGRQLAVAERDDDHVGVAERAVRRTEHVVRRDGRVAGVDRLQRRRVAGDRERRHERVGDGLGVVEAAGEAVAEAALERVELGGVDGPDAPRGERLLDGVADGGQVLRLGHARGDGQQARVARVGERGPELVGELLLDDEALVELRRRPEGERREHVEGLHVGGVRRVDGGPVGGGPAEGDRHPGRRRRVPVDVVGDGPVERGLGRNLGRAVAARPAPEVALHVGDGLLRVEVAGEQHDGVLGPVEAVEERLRVVIALGHRLDVGEKAHRGVAVRVLLEGHLALRLEDLPDGVRGVLVVLAQDRERLGPEVGLGVAQVLKAVGLDAQDGVEVVLEKRRVVDRAVVRGVGVLVAAGALEKVLVLGRRDRLGAPEHHVLEKVGEAAFAGLHLVPRARAHDDLERDHVRKRRRHHDDAQAVGEVADGDVVGKDAAVGLGAGWNGRGGEDEQSEEQAHGGGVGAEGQRGARRN